MRAGPLSNSKVITLLNSSFVPVYTVNEDYSRKGAAPAAEKAERDRIFKEGYAQGRSVGTVHVYLLRPDGHLFDTLHVAQAAKASTLLELLNRATSELKTTPGQPLVTPTPQSRQPACDKDSVPLHLVARSLDGRGAWSEFPVEDWIILTAPKPRSCSRLQMPMWAAPGVLKKKSPRSFLPISIPPRRTTTWPRTNSNG